MAGHGTEHGTVTNQRMAGEESRGKDWTRKAKQLTGKTARGEVLERGYSMSKEDLSMISVDELEADLLATEEDISVCLTAMSMGIDIYGEGSSVADRYEGNKLIRAKIIREMKRRGHTKEAECHTSQS